MASLTEDLNLEVLKSDSRLVRVLEAGTEDSQWKMDLRLTLFGIQIQRMSLGYLQQDMLNSKFLLILVGILFVGKCRLTMLFLIKK